MSHQIRRAGTRWLPRLVVLTVLLLAMPVVASWAWWLPSPSASVRSDGTNAFWLRHSWVQDPHSASEYQGLAQTLVRNQISDAFFHAGPIDADGGIPPLRYPHASQLVQAMHSDAPRIHIQAYIGQITTAAGGGLDLDAPGVRSRLLQTCANLLEQGFDGIHLDIEPLKPSASEVVSLLGDLHALTRAQGRLLSISVGKLEPAPAEALWDRLGSLSWVGTNLLEEIAQRVDQLALMAYDTPLPTAAMIGSAYAWETSQVMRLVGNQVTVFIGVPTFEEHQNANGEDLSTAIRGARRGLGALSPRPSRPEGLAIFAEWTTTPREWKIWHDAWLAP